MIILPDKIIIEYLKQKFVSGLDAIFDDIFGSESFSYKDRESLKALFHNKKFSVLGGYPVQDLKVPSINVVPGDISNNENLIGIDEQIDEADASSLIKHEIFSKTTRIICVADNFNTTIALSTIVQYLIMSGRAQLSENNLANIKLSFQEFDMLQRFYPQQFFYRSMIVSCDVIDSYIESTAKIILDVYVDDVNLKVNLE